MPISSNKTVACIMPVYNYARYLDEAIQSVLNQTRVPDEIIVVDDCSTDNPKAICDLFPQVTYIRHEANKGLAASRNTGIKHAKSEYVFSFDADDILPPRSVEAHLAIAKENTVVTCALTAFGSEMYTAYPEKASLTILIERNCIYSNSMYPKSLWEKIGGFDESPTMRLGLEDWLFWLETAAFGAEFEVSYEMGLLWRRHNMSMSSTSANPNWKTITDYMKNKMKTEYNIE